MKTKILDIKIDSEAIIVSRKNKYVVEVTFDNGKVEDVHLHDPGRLLDLVYPGNRVLLQYKGDNEKRKTAWDIIACRGDDSWVITHSSYPNYLVEELLKNHASLLFGHRFDSVRREVKHGDSRFDFLVENSGIETWIEVKGATYIDNGIAKFPDAPTLRGQKHVNHLTNMVKNGDNCSIIFVITQSKAVGFLPYVDIDPKLSELLYDAKESGVKIYPVVFSFENGEMFFEKVLEF